MECVMCACKEPLRKMDQAAASLGTDELKRRIKTLSKKIKRKKRESEMLKSEIMLKKKDLSQSQGLVSDELYRPHIICTVVEKVVCEEAEEADGACVEHFHDRRKGLILDVKDYMTFFTPSSGLVDMEEVDVGDEVAVKSPLYPIIEKLPRYFPVEAQAMEVQELHGETFDKISGYEKQILELKEAVILPLEKRHLFATIGIQPAKGVLLHGPPGTGKTSMAHACASLARCTFFRVPGAQLVGRYLAEGAQLIRDVFEIAKNKTPAIIFIDDIDAIGRFIHASINFKTFGWPDNISNFEIEMKTWGLNKGGFKVHKFPDAGQFYNVYGVCVARGKGKLIKFRFSRRN